MCRLVMMGVAAFQGDIAVLFRKHQFVVEPAINATTVVMPPEARKYQVTQGHCSCDFYSGARDKSAGSANELERRRRHYERAGWSSAKIERALEAARVALNREKPRSPSAKAFADCVSALVRDGARVSLLAHEFSGSFADPFFVVGRESMGIDAFVSARGAFAQDTLVTLTP